LNVGCLLLKTTVFSCIPKHTPCIILQPTRPDQIIEISRVAMKSRQRTKKTLTLTTVQTSSSSSSSSSSLSSQQPSSLFSSSQQPQQSHFVQPHQSHFTQPQQSHFTQPQQSHFTPSQPSSFSSQFPTSQQRKPPTINRLPFKSTTNVGDFNDPIDDGSEMLPFGGGNNWSANMHPALTHPFATLYIFFIS
jgi:hypothetical protein